MTDEDYAFTSAKIAKIHHKNLSRLNFSQSFLIFILAFHSQAKNCSGERYCKAVRRSVRGHSPATPFATRKNSLEGSTAPRRTAFWSFSA